MDILWDAGLIVVGLVLLFVGGEGLVRGSVSISERFGISKLIVGLVIVGFGTSAPELLVSIQAALAGSPSIAVGNVVGSNIANILLIVGVAALLQPIANDDPAIRRDLLVMLGASVAICLVFLTGEIGPWIGVALTGSLLIYLAASYIIEKRRLATAGPNATPNVDLGAETAMGPAVALLAAAAGIAALVFGANFMVEGATGLAREIGLSEAVIGLTIVAIGTSLPELATAIVAARKREAEVILANVVGSNVFNILSILGITALIAPITVEPRFAYVDGPIALVVALAATVYLYRFTRIGKPIGAALLVSYLLYLLIQNLA